MVQLFHPRVATELQGKYHLAWVICYYSFCQFDTAAWDRSSDAFLPKERCQLKSLPSLPCVKHRCRKIIYLVLAF